MADQLGRALAIWAAARAAAASYWSQAACAPATAIPISCWRPFCTAASEYARWDVAAGSCAGRGCELSRLSAEVADDCA